MFLFDEFKLALNINNLIIRYKYIIILLDVVLEGVSNSLVWVFLPVPVLLVLALALLSAAAFSSFISSFIQNGHLYLKFLSCRCLLISLKFP